jgi:hypothetical protein
MTNDKRRLEEEKIELKAKLRDIDAVRNTRIQQLKSVEEAIQRCAS